MHPAVEGTAVRRRTPEEVLVRPRARTAAVAATDSWTDPDGFRMPAGLVHAWQPGTNQTMCGLPIRKALLGRFPHVEWVDVQPETGRDADRVVEVCRRCVAAMGGRRDAKPWTRDRPRP
jgi:hypothetical protein